MEFKNLHWFLKLVLAFAGVFLVFSIVFILPKILPTRILTNSQVSGLIYQDQNWQGTITITGDTVALPNTTVNVLPGTKIVVLKQNDKSNFDFLPWHLKSGINTQGYDHGVNKNEPFWDEGQKIQVHLNRLIAIGSKELPITISSDSQTGGSPYDFNVWSFKSGVMSGVKISDYRRMEIGQDVTIRESSMEQVGECAICISRGNPSIVNNVFGSTFRESIWVNKASPRITDNNFNNLVGDGIRIKTRRAGMPVISFNDFEMPGGVALDILDGDEPNSGVVSFNKFSGNSKIGIACDSKINFVQNQISSLIYFQGNGCGGNYTFGPNYWGSKNVKTVMMEQITNKDRKFNIKIMNILSTPPQQIGPRLR